MGDTASNIVAGPHMHGGQRAGYRVHYHLGESVSMSPDATATAFANFRMAALNAASDSDLDELGVTAWGSWYTTWIASSSAARSNLRGGMAYLTAP